MTNYTAADFDFAQSPAVAVNPQVYQDFLPRISIDGDTFHFNRRDEDDEHWITAIYYRNNGGKEVVALRR
jgi:Tol biopolymer transport system component